MHDARFVLSVVGYDPALEHAFDAGERTAAKRLIGIANKAFHNEPLGDSSAVEAEELAQFLIGRAGSFQRDARAHASQTRTSPVWPTPPRAERVGTNIPPPGSDEPDASPPPSGPTASRLAGARPSGAAGWPPWTGLAALFSGLVATIVGSAIVAAASGTASLEDPPAGVNIALTLLQNLALVGSALLFARLAGRPTAVDFGLRRPPLKRAAGLLLAVWLGFYVISALWVLALGIDEHQELPDRLGADQGTLNLLAVVVLITVVAPLGEELFFRGYFFGALRNWRGVWLAAIGTGTVFGLIHLGSAPAGFLVPLAFFGTGLCLLYHYSGSLYPCIALHALNNSIALGAALGWSWEIPVTMVGSTIAALAIAALLARALGARPRGPAAAPAT
jgi:membrane protease YdiL (CAAX protease family)